MELLWCMEAGGSSFWYNSNRVDQPTLALEDACRGWSDVLRTVCGSLLSYLHLPLKKHSLCLDLTVFGVPIQVRMQSDAVKTVGIICIIGIGIGVGLTSWLVCKLQGPAGRSYGRALRWGRDIRTWDGGQRSRSLVAASKAIAARDLSSEFLWSRRRRPACDLYGADDGDQQSSASSLYVSGNDANNWPEADAELTVLPRPTDEPRLDREANGPSTLQRARPVAHGVRCTLDYVRYGQLIPDSELPDFTDTFIAGTDGDQVHPLWHPKLIPGSNVPSLQSSTRDSGFLEWAPTDLVQSTDDDRVAQGVLRPPLDAERGQPGLRQEAETSLPQTQQFGAEVDCLPAVAETSTGHLVSPSVDVMLFSSRAPRHFVGDPIDWSVAAWLAQQEQQWPDVQQPSAGIASELGTDCETSARQQATGIGAAATGASSALVTNAGTPTGVVCLSVQKPAQQSGVAVVTTCQDVLGNGSQVMAALPKSATCRTLPANGDANGNGSSACRTALVNLSGTDLSESAEPHSLITDIYSDLSLSEAQSEEQLLDGCLSPDEASHVTRPDGVDRPWSPTSNATSEQWADDASSCSAGSSLFTSPVHATLFSRCPKCSALESPARVDRDTCDCRADAGAADPVASPVHVGGSAPSPVGPDTMDRLAAIEMELGTIKAEMSEMEQCLQSFIARDAFDGCYSPERFHKLTRVVLESEHIAGMTSAEIGKAFDILRKYRQGPGSAPCRDNASPFTRGSSWPDKTGAAQERRSSFSGSRCHNRSSTLSEPDMGDKGVSSDDEFVSRKNSSAAAAVVAAAGRPSLLSSSIAGTCATRRACIRSSSSLTNLAGQAYEMPVLCRVGHMARDAGYNHVDRVPVELLAGERGQSVPFCGSVFKGLKLVDIADYRQAVSAACIPESDALARGYLRILEDLGLSRMCTVEGSIGCCALRATLLGTLLGQLPLASRLQQAATAIKAANAQSFGCTWPRTWASDVPSDTVISAAVVADDGSTAALESFLAAVDQEVKVLEGCLARHAGNASLQHDVEMLSDLLLGVFNDSNRDAMLLGALDVVTALQACQPVLGLTGQQPRCNGAELEPCATGDSFASPGHLFWRRLLGSQEGFYTRRKPVAMTDLGILAEALGCVLLLLRPACFGQTDFASYLPAQPANADVCISSRTGSSRPIIALVTEDDERYCLALP